MPLKTARFGEEEITLASLFLSFYKLREWDSVIDDNRFLHLLLGVTVKPQSQAICLLKSLRMQNYSLEWTVVHRQSMRVLFICGCCVFKCPAIRIPKENHRPLIPQDRYWCFQELGSMPIIYGRRQSQSRISTSTKNGGSEGRTDSRLTRTLSDAAGRDEMFSLIKARYYVLSVSIILSDVPRIQWVVLACVLFFVLVFFSCWFNTTFLKHSSASADASMCLIPFVSHKIVWLTD